jgi:hypothetical protein
MPLTPEERRKKKAANKIKANTIDVGIPRIYKDSPNPTHRGIPVQLDRPV